MRDPDQHWAIDDSPVSEPATSPEAEIVGWGVRPISRRTLGKVAGAAAAVGAVSGVTQVAGAPAAYALPATNLLANPSFNTLSGSLPASWAVIDGTVTSATTPVHSTGRSVLLSDTSTTKGTWLRSAAVSVSAQQPYEASAWVRGVSGPAWVYVEFWNSSNVRIGVRTAQLTGTTGVWKQTRAYGISPVGTVTATLLCYLSVATTGSAYYDDAYLGEPDVGTVSTFPTVVSSHPRMYFTSADVPALQAKTLDTTPTLAGPSAKDRWDGIIVAADDYVTESSFTVSFPSGPRTYAAPTPMPPMDASYPYWTALCATIQTRMETLALAYQLALPSNPNKAAYASRAKSWLLTICGWSGWTDTAWGGDVLSNLDTSYLTLGCAAVYDMVYDTLTPAERSTAESALNLKGLVPLWLDGKADYEAQLDHNIAMMRLCALGGGSIAVLGVNARTDQFLTTATGYMTFYLNLRRTSGSNEGFMYTTLAMDYLLRTADLIQRATGVDVVGSHPYVNPALAAGGPNVVTWGAASVVPGGPTLPYISDHEDSGRLQVTMSILQTKFNSDLAAWYLQEVKPPFTKLTGFLYGCTYGTPPDPTPPLAPTAQILNGVGWATMRSGWGNDDELFLLVANNTALSHNHYDQGSFVIGRSGTWIATDPGYQAFSGTAATFTQKTGHSTLMVDAAGQTVKGACSMSAGIVSPWCSYLVANLKGAWGTTLTTCYRYVVSLPGIYTLLHDRITAPAAHTYQWRMYNGMGASFTIDGAPFAVDATVTGSVVRVTNANARLAATFVNSPTRSVQLVAPITADYGPAITVSGGTASTSNTFTTFLQTAPVSSSLTPVAVTTLLTTPVMGWRVTRPDSSVDAVAIRVTSGTFTLDGTSTDGNHLVVNKLGTTVRQYAATYATTVTSSGQTLLSSASPSSVSAQLSGSSLLVRIYSASAQTISLYSPVGSSFTVDGSATAFSYNGSTKVLTYSATAGYHDLVIS